MKQFSLSVPKPCHENWDAMTPQDKGRFCVACQKAVVDFSSMSDRQIAGFFKKPTDAVCGRFDGSQLNRIVEVPRKPLPWVKYLFTIAWPAFLLSLKTSAQKVQTDAKRKTSLFGKRTTGFVAVSYRTDWKKDTTKPEASSAGQVTEANVPKIVKGQILNNDGQPVPYATVAAKEEGRAVVADSSGTFALKYFTVPLLLEVSSVGYRAKKTAFNGEESCKVFLEPASIECLSGTVGLVAITSVRKKKPLVSLLQPLKSDTAFAKFSVYPNPVHGNGVVTIDPQKIEPGKYDLSIIAGNGNILQRQPVVFEKGRPKQTVTLQNLPSGVYFIRLNNGINAKDLTEKILVQ